MITGTVVLYNTKKDLIDRVIRSYAPSDNRILFFIDNSERKSGYLDGYHEYVRYFHMEKNLGYGSANNVGLDESLKLNAKYHIVMNPDVYFEPDVISELEIFLDNNQDIASIMPKVTKPNGEEQYLAKLLPSPFDVFSRRFLPNVGFVKRNNERYILKNIDRSNVIDVPSLSGCFMFLNNHIMEKSGIRFDERYFMYFEDFDFIRRLHRYGKTVYYPDAVIIHEHEKASYKNNRMLIEHIKSGIRYFNKFGWIIDPEREEFNRSVWQSNRKM